MSATPPIKLNFEPSGTDFFDIPDGSLYSFDHSSQSVAKNDGQFIAAQQIIRETSISIYLKAVHHGTIGDNPASLLLFEFNFFTPRPQYRIKYSSINIEFNYTATPRPPHIDSFWPRQLVGEEARRAIANVGTAGLRIGAGHPAISANLGVARTEQYEQLSRFKLLSRITKTHSDGKKVNGVQWVLNENANSKAGIPHLISIALLIKRNDMHNFDTKINIEARISPNVNPRTWLGMFTGVPIPITIDVNTVTGNLDVDSLETVNLATLVGPPQCA